MAQKVLITGASGGFGRLITLSLLKKGHSVVATMRHPQGKNKSAADELQSAGAAVLEIDVTDGASVEHGVAAAIDQTGGLDGVVNNAGVGAIGLQETFTPQDWQKIFDINVFGVQRVNRAVLPHMRKREGGLIIYISSLLGRMTLPFYGPYNASKWALEALAENYRTELSRFGVDSCIVEPGGYPTPFMENLFTPGDTSRDDGYGEYTTAPMALLKGFEKALAENKEQKPQDVADAVVELIETPAGRRRFRTVVDKMGMGDHIEGYNDKLEWITKGIYEAFGLRDMLKLKTHK